MNIEDLFRDLSHGEMSNLAMAVSGEGTITEKMQPKVILAANDALIAVHTKFILRENDLLLEMVDGVTNYHFLKKFSQSVWQEGDEGYPYILDLGNEPFQQDVIKVLAVYGPNGQTVPLNDANNPCSFFTPQGSVLQTPIVRPGGSLSVQYQASHPKLSLDDTTQEIELPDVLVPAFRAYTAGKVFAQINTQEAIATSQMLINLYEGICQDCIDRDLLSTSISTSNTRFHNGGWV